jgi:hypothetical protein
MGDAGEGLIDQESRIQERMEELEQDRMRKGGKRLTPAQVKAIESLQSLKLARTEMQRQQETATHEGRRAQLAQALAELDRRMSEVSALIN